MGMYIMVMDGVMMETTIKNAILTMVTVVVQMSIPITVRNVNALNEDIFFVISYRLFVCLFLWTPSFEGIRYPYWDLVYVRGWRRW